MWELQGACTKLLEFSPFTEMSGKKTKKYTSIFCKIFDYDCTFQFLLIFRKAAAGELLEDSGLNDLYRNVSEIDVHEEGVSGAKDFFTSKVC